MPPDMPKKMRSVRKRKREDQRETEQVEKEKDGGIANLDIKDMAMEASALTSISSPPLKEPNTTRHKVKKAGKKTMYWNQW